MAVANTLADCVSPVACTIKFIVGFGLTQKYQTRLERLARDKHSRLLQTFVNYSCKQLPRLELQKGL
jgi:hypothetical protein